MNTACASAVDCPCDSLPQTGFSSETADEVEFISTAYVGVIPALGNSVWSRLSCQMTASNPNDQMDADLAATSLATQCALGALSPYPPDTFPGSPSTGGLPSGGNNSPTQQVFVNAQQTAVFTCPDGLTFSYTVAAGQFTGTSQLDADTKAITFANQQANIRAICLSALSNTTATTGQVYTGTITATGGQLASGNQSNNWQIISGTLPAGLNFQGDSPSLGTATISGTPTATGTFPFAVQITDPQGNTQTKQFSLSVQCGTSFTIIQNFAGLGPANPFQSVAATAPYDTEYRATNIVTHPGSGNFGNGALKVQFTSNASKTWNLKVGGTGALNGFSAYTINGQSTFVPTDGAGNWSAQFTIVTSGCTPTQVNLDYIANNTSNTGFMEWQTPS